MSQSRLDRWAAEAKALGVEHAQNAAAWSFDGNSDAAERARVLDMLRDGDPQAWDHLPQPPNLSGEWAGDLTPVTLAERITGEPAYGEAAGDAVEMLADSYELGVSETFGP